MPSVPKSNRCCGTSNTPPEAPRSSATGCSSKPSSTKRAPAHLARPAPGVRGLECRLPAVPPLGTAHPLETTVGADPPQQERPTQGALHRFDHCAGSSTCRPPPPPPNGGQPAQALGRSRGAAARGLPRRPHPNLPGVYLSHLDMDYAAAIRQHGLVSRHCRAIL